MYMGFKSNNINANDDEKIILNNIEKTNNKFNELMISYIVAYKELIKQVLKNQMNPVLEKYAGKNVKLSGSDNKFFYINKFGFSQEYINFAKRPISCASPPIPISPEEFVLFPKGNVLGEDVDCGLEGNNILDNDNNSYSWINNSGNRLQYSEEVWTNRSNSCKDVRLINVNSNNLKNFTSDGAMTKETVCTRLNINPKLVQEIEKLNNQLTTLANYIILDIKKLSNKGKKLSKELEIILHKVKNKRIELFREKKQIENGEFEFGNTFNSNLEELRADTELRVTSNFTRYLILLFLCFFLIGLSIYTLVFNNQSILAQGIIACVCIFAIYNLIVIPIYNLIVMGMNAIF